MDRFKTKKKERKKNYICASCFFYSIILNSFLCMWLIKYFPNCRSDLNQKILSCPFLSYVELSLSLVCAKLLSLLNKKILEKCWSILAALVKQMLRSFIFSRCLTMLQLTPDSLIFLHIYSSFLYMVLSVWLLSLKSSFPHWSCVQCFSVECLKTPRTLGTVAQCCCSVWLGN